MSERPCEPGMLHCPRRACVTSITTTRSVGAVRIFQSSPHNSSGRRTGSRGVEARRGCTASEWVLHRSRAKHAARALPSDSELQRLIREERGSDRPLCSSNLTTRWCILHEIIKQKYRRTTSLPDHRSSAADLVKETGVLPNRSLISNSPSAEDIISLKAKAVCHAPAQASRHRCIWKLQIYQAAMLKKLYNRTKPLALGRSHFSGQKTALECQKNTCDTQRPFRAHREPSPIRQWPLHVKDRSKVIWYDSTTATTSIKV
jgi:hypothetical protein